MFHLITYCWSWLQAIQEPLRKVALLVLGLEGAGKASLIREIQRVLSCEVLPTTKPNQTEFRVDRFEVSLINPDGGQRTWKNHYSKAHGIIFVLDSSNVAQMDEVKKTFARVLGHPKISGKPLLLLANKQDKLDALLPSEIIEYLSLEKLVNESKSLCRIEPSSATKRLPRTQCRTIIQGLHWLLRIIAVNYGALSDRIQKDSLEPHQLSEREVSRKARRPRSKTREEREPPAKRGNSQEQNAKVEESKPPKSSQNILSQKEDRTMAPKKKKKKVNLKMKKKGSVQSSSTLAEDVKGKMAASGSKCGAIGGLIQNNKVAQENPRIRETSPTPAEGALDEMQLAPSASVRRLGVILDASLTTEKQVLPGGQSTKKKNKTLKNKSKSKERAETQRNENLSSTFDLYRRAMLALKMQQEGPKTHSISIS